MEYVSRARLFGIPLVHISSASQVSGDLHRRTARGWIAIGDQAIGILFAAGGIAYGGVAIGGLACGAVAVGGVGVGILTLAGLAVGGYAVGGLGLGVVAIAGLALAIYGAFGGAAIAVQYATGGLAIARHSNDDAAQQFMASSWMQAGKQLAQLPAWGWWLVAAVLFLPHVISWWITSRQRSG